MLRNKPQNHFNFDFQESVGLIIKQAIKDTASLRDMKRKEYLPTDKNIEKNIKKTFFWLLPVL